MRILSNCCCFLFLCISSLMVVAQTDHFSDSLRKNLATAKDDRQRAQALINLSLFYNILDSVQSEQYARRAIETAELTRDRHLMISIYLNNGRRYLNNGSLTGTVERALDNFRKAEKLAGENGREEDLIESHIYMADGYFAMGDNDRALEYGNLAVAALGGNISDSVKVNAYAELGDVYQVRNEKLLAFRNYLEASNIAEQSGNAASIRLADGDLANFYKGIGDYEKAIDYRMHAIEVTRKAGELMPLLNQYNSLGNLFEQKKDYDLALSMYTHAIALADSIKFEIYKINSYINIFKMYFSGQQYKKGMDYLAQHPEVLAVTQKGGLQYFIDENYGMAYTGQKRYDSAYFYLHRAEQAMQERGSPYTKYQIYDELGDFYKQKGDNKKAVEYYLKVRDISLAVKSLDFLQKNALNLDTIYQRLGDYKTAHIYNSAYEMYTDSLRNLSREADLLNLEVKNDNQRRERLAKEEETRTEHRHNVQYMGFTVGLIAVFVVLVMLGIFAVSPRTIRALGFFSFIFLFEFIILLADKQIHELTHGEPWKVLLIKVFLAALLLPLHHWLEHKVIHYLTTRRKIILPGRRETGPAAGGAH